MALDPKFQKFTTASPIMASYDWIDVANGLGIVVFYGTRTEISTGAAYALVENALMAGGVGSERILGSTTATFETSVFNSPRTVKGTAYISGETIAQAGDTGRITATIKKWDGTNETNISSAVQSQVNGAGSEGIFMPLNLTETRFKIGDTLRVTIVAAGFSASFGFYIDPISEAGKEPFKVLIPFRITV